MYFKFTIQLRLAYLFCLAGAPALAKADIVEDVIKPQLRTEYLSLIPIREKIKSYYNVELSPFGFYDNRVRELQGNPEEQIFYEKAVARALSKAQLLLSSVLLDFGNGGEATFKPIYKFICFEYPVVNRQNLDREEMKYFGNFTGGIEVNWGNRTWDNGINPRIFYSAYALYQDSFDLLRVHASLLNHLWSDAKSRQSIIIDEAEQIVWKSLIKSNPLNLDTLEAQNPRQAPVPWDRLASVGLAPGFWLMATHLEFTLPPQLSESEMSYYLAVQKHLVDLDLALRELTLVTRLVGGQSLSPELEKNLKAFLILLKETSNEAANTQSLFLHLRSGMNDAVLKSLAEKGQALKPFLSPAEMSDADFSVIESKSAALASVKTHLNAFQKSTNYHLRIALRGQLVEHRVTRILQDQLWPSIQPVFPSFSAIESWYDEVVLGTYRKIKIDLDTQLREAR